MRRKAGIKDIMFCLGVAARPFAAQDRSDSLKVRVINDQVKLKATGAKRYSRLFLQVAVWKLRAQGDMSALSLHKADDGSLGY